MIIPLLLSLCAVPSTGFVKAAHFFPAVQAEISLYNRVGARRLNAGKAAVLADRKVYWTDDASAQLVAVFPGLGIQPPAANYSLQVTASNGAQQFVDTLPVSDLASWKVVLLVNLTVLKSGTWSVGASLLVPGIPARVADPALFSVVAPAAPKSTLAPIKLQGVTTGLQTVGLPFPVGALSVDSAPLLDIEERDAAGKLSVAPAQRDVVSTWTPQGPGVKPSVRWLRVRFPAQPACTYRAILGKGVAAQTPYLAAQEGTTWIVRVAGNRYDFPIRGAPYQSYLVDQDGNQYEQSIDSTVIEESGRLRSTIRVAGSYRSATRPDFNRFVTRYFFEAGNPGVRITHRILLTEDTARKISDAGFIVPGKGTGWSIGLDGVQQTGLGSAYILQDRWNHASIISNSNSSLGTGLDGGTGNAAEGRGARGAGASIDSGMGSGVGSGTDSGVGSGGMAGIHSDGWISNGGVQVSVESFWQRYPKELEASPTGVTLHLWPKHGGNTFSVQERTGLGDIYKLRYAHQGHLLDLHLPPEELSALRASDIRSSGLPGLWDEEMEIQKAAESTSEGLAFTATFQVSKPGSLTAQSIPLADPAWTTATGAFEPISIPNANHQLADYLFGTAWPRGNEIVTSMSGEYGMWIWPGNHDNWDPNTGRAALHRVWNNSHYQDIALAWLLCVRGGPTCNLAREWTQTFMDVGMTNSLDRPIRFHVLGGMHHVKAFLPWGNMTSTTPMDDSDGGVIGHFTDPDALLYSWYLTGNLQALESYRQWGTSVMQIDPPVGGASRDAVTGIANLTAYYQATWDPQVILWFATVWGNGSFESYDSPIWHPMWHGGWLERYERFTRDPRVLPRTQSYLAAGFNNMEALSFVARRAPTPEAARAILARAAGLAYDVAGCVYRNPSDPLNNIGPYISAANNMTYRELLDYTSAMDQFGMKEDRSAKGGALIVSMPSGKEAGTFEEKHFIGRVQGTMVVPKGAKTTIQLWADFQGTEHSQPVRVIIPGYADTTLQFGSKRPKLDLVLDAKNGELRIPVYIFAKDQPKIVITGPFTWIGD